ncbi:hypothetical protein OOZ15_04205 [Galbibacter sp. EGI 63066]|nr:hypothetical protein [Galbibacter sp. EGI 63066]MCX2679135.1 hypothetical protein [Galbibacter sp. EGI 63066]
MALIVLFSTLSFTVDMHYCGDSLIDVAVLKPAETCGMVMHMNADKTISENKCCTDEQIVVEGQKELKTSFEKLSFDQQVFLTAYIFTSLNLFEGLKENIIPFQHYTPPLLVTEILIENETFLI